MSVRRSLIAALVVGLLMPAAASADQLTVRGTKVFKSVEADLQTQFGNEFVTFAGHLYFVANDDVHGIELWRTDGTDAGTELVSDIYPGLPNTNSKPHRLTVLGDRLWFNAYNDTTQSPETVYYIDAAAPTTVKLARVNPVGPGAPKTAVGSLIGTPNGRMLMGRLAEGNGYYGVYSAAPGTDLFSIISVPGDSMGLVNLFTPAATAGGWTYFLMIDSSNQPNTLGFELWRSNGVIVELVKNIYPGNGSSSPGAFVATSNRVYFSANDGVHGTELWVTDPANPADTRMLREHTPGTAGSGYKDPGAVANGNVLYYTPNDPVTGPEVWRTDGTEAGTRVVKDITPGTDGFLPAKPFALGAGIGILRGGNIWSSTDGTEATTSLVGTATGDGYGPNTPVALGNRGFFVAGGNPFAQMIWRTDGTAAGTLPFSAGGLDGTAATSGNISAQTLAFLGDKLIFFALDPATNSSGWKLYVIDTSRPDEQRTATAPPTISGTPQVGKYLEASKGTWSGRPTAFSYQWLRNGQPIDRADNAGYYATAADLGQAVSVRVTTLGIGAPREATADSGALTIVAAPPAGGGGAIPAPPAAGPKPGVTPPAGGTPNPPTGPSLIVKKKAKLTGTARVGKTLKLNLPTFTQKTGIKLSYVWTADGKTINKKTKSSLKLTSKQKGKKVSVTITATKTGFAPTKITLGPTAKVKAAAKKR